MVKIALWWVRVKTQFHPAFRKGGRTGRAGPVPCRVMRRTPWLAACAALVASLLTPLTATAAPDCATTLTCRTADIDRMTMAERVAFVRAVEHGPAAELGAGDRWGNIEGVISFFRD